MTKIKAIAAKNNKAVSLLMEQSKVLPDLIIQVSAQVDAVQERMKELEEAGLIYATGHWRASKYFMLVYPQKEGVRPSPTYIGTDEAKIQLAMEGIERAKEYESLAAIVRHQADSLLEAEHLMSGITRILANKFA